MKKFLVFGLLACICLQPIRTFADTTTSPTEIKESTTTSNADLIRTEKNTVPSSTVTTESSESVTDTPSQTESSSSEIQETSAIPTSSEEPISSSSTQEVVSADSTSTSDRKEPIIKKKEEARSRRLRSAPLPVLDENNPVPVGTASELAQAIRSGLQYIRLTSDINIGDAAIPVKSSVVIDGDNKYTYMYSGGENWNKGIYFAASNISITFKNLKIGDRSVKNSANNYYGIAPAENLIKNSQIIVENVDYYSDRGAQPFHIRDKSNQIIFKGKNSFFITKVPGSVLVQEFAEGTNFLFEANSDTSITIEKNELVGTFWSATGPVKIELKKNARLNVVSCNAFIYTDAMKDNQVIIGENAILNVKETNPLQGNLIHQNHNLKIDIQKNGQLIAETVKKTPFNSASSLSLGPGSKALLKNINGDFYQLGTGTIIVDNAAELSFETGKKDKCSPTGLTAMKENLIVQPFNPETKSYGVFADNQLLETQTTDGTWFINGKNFKRTPQAIPDSVAEKLGSSSTFKLVRNVDQKDKPVDKPKDSPKDPPKDKPVGKLQLLTAPDFDFGVTLITNDWQTIRPQMKGSLTIEDSRNNSNKKAKLYLRVTQPFKNGDLDLTSNLTYINQSGQEKVLSENLTLVEENNALQQRDISKEWNEATDDTARGLKLKIPVEKQKVGTFTGQLEWSLQDVPGN